MNQSCGECKWWQVETLQHGSCQHPLTVVMRHAVKHNVVPFAFRELEVTYVLRDGGTDCPCFERRKS